jgi:AbrB family looped-hinge helix DNA binding protein
MAIQVRKRTRGTTRISTKHQVTIPSEAMRRAGLRAGDELVVREVSRGQVVLARRADVILKYAGALTGAYGKGYLDKLRNEWR